MGPHHKTCRKQGLRCREANGGNSGSEREGRTQRGFNPASDSFITSPQQKAMSPDVGTCLHFSKELEMTEDITLPDFLMSLAYALLESLL